MTRSASFITHGFLVRRLDPAIRLRHLVALSEVARQASVVKAARSLGITQPAVSKTIRELEDILEVELFDRSRRGVTLTRTGEIFRDHANAALGTLREGIDRLGQATAPEALPVRIGALPTVSARLLPAAVARFMAHGLAAAPRIVTGPNAYLMAQLRDGDLDIVIGRMAEPSEMTGFSFEHLYSERIAFIVRPGHPLIDAPHLDMAAVGSLQFLMPPRGSVIRPTVDRLFLAIGLQRPEHTIETVSPAFARPYVRASNAVWVISEGVALNDLRDGTLALLPIDTSDSLGPVGITTRSGTRPGVAAEIMLGEIRTAAEGLEPRRY